MWDSKDQARIHLINILLRASLKWISISEALSESSKTYPGCLSKWASPNSAGLEYIKFEANI